MARNNRNDEAPPKGVLTNDGIRKANNFLLDLLRPDNSGEGYKKSAVTFTLDRKTGDIVELGTGKRCEVRWLRK